MVKCNNCKKDINENDGNFPENQCLCGNCACALMDKIEIERMQFYEDKTPKQISLFEITEMFKNLKDEINELTLYVKNKKQATTKKRNGRITKKERLMILERDKYTCQNCKDKLDPKKLHIDHIIPFSISKNNNPSNLRVLCIKCNLLKKNYIFNERGKSNGL